MSIPWAVWLAMYTLAGWLYVSLSPLSSKHKVDVVICIWVFWIFFFVWDIICVSGKILLTILEGLLEVFD